MSIPTPYSINEYQPSNLYASKIYSEHPIMMWSLDDSLDYLDLIGDVIRTMDYVGPSNPDYEWEFKGLQREGMYSQTAIKNVPFEDSLVNKLYPLEEYDAYLAYDFTNSKWQIVSSDLIYLKVGDQLVVTNAPLVDQSNNPIPNINGTYTISDIEEVFNGTAYYATSLDTILTGISGGSASSWGTFNITGLKVGGICEGPKLFTFDSLSNTLGSFSVGAYFYSDSVYLDTIEIGIRYFDAYENKFVEKTKSIEAPLLNTWVFLSETFLKVDVGESGSPSMAGIRPIIKLFYDNEGGSIDLYNVYLNGLTVGQWAEDTNTISLGVTPLSTSVDIEQACNAALNINDLVECKPYGIAQPSDLGTPTRFAKSGFYLTSDTNISSRNTSIPMVFGSTNVTQIFINDYEVPGTPSIIFPAQGFLNKKGQHNQYSVEFWMRLKCDAQTPVRIFGPISSSDGVYVDSDFITLSIGNNKASHFISEWYRPMLININVIKNGASLLINGEEVISLSFNTNDLDLPEEIVKEANQFQGKSNDWIGFYSTQDTYPFEIDCVAIYSYPISETVAKRRLVYGQGVVSPEFIDSSYNGVTAYIDYSFADYTANYNYPDFARWSQGNYDNLSATSKSLSTPTYSLPQIFIDGTTKTVEDMYQANKDNQISIDPSFTLKPNSILFPDNSWDTVNSYMYIPSLQSISGTIRSIYGIFEVDAMSYTSEQILFYLENPINKEYIKVIIDGSSSIKYYFNGEEIGIDNPSELHGSSKFVAGINFDLLINRYGTRMSRFFGNRKNLSLYIGGDTNLDKTFSGKIYRVGICNRENSFNFELGFRNDGITYATGQVLDGSTVIVEDIPEYFRTAKTYPNPLKNDIYATYMLLPVYEANNYYLDISTSGYWEDYMPLSYFGQFVSDDSNNERYALNFLQVNIGYPKPSDSLGSAPVYNTVSSQVRSYVTFQETSSGSNKLQNSFLYSSNPPINGVIDLDSFSDWKKRKFEIVDGTIIYPRSDTDFNKLSMVYRIEFNAKQSINKPISIKRFEIASQAFQPNTFNKIGTRFGVEAYPYQRSGVYYDYAAKNPYRIYKGNTPYLYLTRDSGIEPCGIFNTSSERGISIPINKNESGDYEVSAIQFFVRDDRQQFSSEDIKLFEIVYAGDKVGFYSRIANLSGTRAKIYSKQESTGKQLNGLSYYLNGNLVSDLVLTTREWSCVGISFNPPLQFHFTLGELNITSPLLFNNISYYQATDLEKKQSLLTRKWIEVLNSGSNTLDWEYWLNGFQWEDVLIAGTTRLYGVNPASIYSTYIGTNRIIIDDEDGMSLDDDTIRVYQDTSWSISVGTPV